MDEKISTKLDLGNTGNSVSKGGKRARIWFLTWNNYPENWISEISKNYTFKNYVMQEEIGDCGTKHIQGVIEFNNQKKLCELHNKIKEIHWEICRNKQAAIDYCSKVETRNGKVITKGWIVKKPIRDPITTPYEWQQKILDILKTEPDDRSIYWIYDETGGKGKTSLTKHICLNYNAIAVHGKGNDIKYAVSKWIEEKGEIEAVLMNIPRTMEDYVSYDAIECIKDGIYFSGKYESSMTLFNNPHVFIFANFGPNTLALTEDRWKIITI